jgi:hypothetical protein
VTLPAVTVKGYCPMSSSHLGGVPGVYTKPQMDMGVKAVQAKGAQPVARQEM